MEKFNYALSVIVPFFNEEQSLPGIIKGAQAVLSHFSQQSEIIFVDDGSADAGIQIVKNEAKSDKRIKLVAFKKNFGQTAAWAAGIDHAKGDVIAFLDADLQNDPADILMLAKKLGEGFDVISGWRKDRKDSLLTRRIPSQIANWLISTVTGVHLHDYGCSLKLYRAEILRGVKLYGEMHRFLPAYAAWEGARITEVIVNHQERRHGVSKYGLGRISKVILDLTTVSFLGGFATKPIYFFGRLGFVLFLLGLATLGLVAYRVLILQNKEATPAVFMMVVFFISSIQLILMGLLAEMVMRVYHQGQERPVYRISEKINF